MRAVSWPPSGHLSISRPSCHCPRRTPSHPWQGGSAGTPGQETFLRTAQNFSKISRKSYSTSTYHIAINSRLRVSLVSSRGQPGSHWHWDCSLPRICRGRGPWAHTSSASTGLWSCAWAAPTSGSLPPRPRLSGGTAHGGSRSGAWSWIWTWAPHCRSILQTQYGGLDQDRGHISLQLTLSQCLTALRTDPDRLVVHVLDWCFAGRALATYHLSTGPAVVTPH